MVLDKGHLTFSDVTLTAVSAAITTRPGQLHDLAAQVSGVLNGADGGRLFVKYSNGTIGYEWRNAGVFNGSQNVSGNFTTPSGISSFQVGTEVVLDKGHLTFSGVTLAAYSDPIAVTAGQEYELAAQVNGRVQAGQGGQMVSLYGGVPHAFWQNLAPGHICPPAASPVFCQFWHHFSRGIVFL